MKPSPALAAPLLTALALTLAAGPAAAWGSRCYYSYDSGSSASYTAKSGVSSNSGSTAEGSTTVSR